MYINCTTKSRFWKLSIDKGNSKAEFSKTIGNNWRKHYLDRRYLNTIYLLDFIKQNKRNKMIKINFCSKTSVFYMKWFVTLTTTVMFWNIKTYWFGCEEFFKIETPVYLDKLIYDISLKLNELVIQDHRLDYINWKLILRGEREFQ